MDLPTPPLPLATATDATNVAQEARVASRTAMGLSLLWHHDLERHVDLTKTLEGLVDPPT